MRKLTVYRHDRNAVGATYVYPVVSRRANGVSIGVNLNPNNACNWRCIYCQVPGLTRGKAPPIDLTVLQAELSTMLRTVVEGSFLASNVAPELRRLNDVALSGNGEPTTSRDLPAVLVCIEDQLAQFGLLGRIKVVLITNGSMTHEPWVQESLRHMARINGEVWFKLDRATGEGLTRVNSVKMSPADHLDRLRGTARIASTFVQTCLFALDGEPPAAAELDAYLAMLASLVEDRVPLRGVLLYGIARQSHQPEAPRLTPLPAPWLEEFAVRIRAVGLPATVSP